jgi:hypothetical protein
LITHHRSPSFPYSKKAKLKEGSVCEAISAKVFTVINNEEIGLNYIYQDLHPNSGKFYTSYPYWKDRIEIDKEFIEIQQ